MADPLAELIRSRPLVNTRQAAKVLGVSERSVLRMIDAGQLAAGRLGDSANAPYAIALDDVLARHLIRVFGLDDEDQDDDDTPDPLQPTLDQAMEDRRSA